MKRILLWGVNIFAGLVLLSVVVEVSEPPPKEPNVYFYCLMLKEIIEEGRVGLEQIKELGGSNIANHPAVRAIWRIPPDKSLERLAYRTYCPAEKGYLPPENLSATIPRLQPDDIEQCQNLQRRAVVGAIGEGVIIEQFHEELAANPEARQTLLENRAAWEKAKRIYEANCSWFGSALKENQ